MLSFEPSTSRDVHTGVSHRMHTRSQVLDGGPTDIFSKEYLHKVITCSFLFMMFFYKNDGVSQR